MHLVQREMMRQAFFFGVAQTLLFNLSISSLP
jgi:hypothetical protein